MPASPASPSIEYSSSSLMGSSSPGLGHGDCLLDPQSQPQSFGDLAQLPVLVVAEHQAGTCLQPVGEHLVAADTECPDIGIDALEAQAVLVDIEAALGFPVVTDRFAGGTQRLAAIAKKPHRGGSQPLVLQEMQGDQLAAQPGKTAEVPRFRRKL